MKRIRQTFALLVASSCFVGWLGISTLGQSDAARKLTRNDVEIRKDLPLAGICVDAKLNKGKKLGDSGMLWLRIYNNTIWTFEFEAGTGGYPAKVIRLSNGRTVVALDRDSVATPHYELKRLRPGPEIGYLWGDIGTFSYLPSDTSAVFSVPAKYFPANRLSIRLSYEWEFGENQVFATSSPLQQVFFSMSEHSDLGDYYCR